MDGLNRALASSGQLGLTELSALLEELLGGREPEACFAEQQTLKAAPEHRVLRVRFAINGQTRMLILKRLRRQVAGRTELVVGRWLPAVGLAGCAAQLLGTVAEHSGAFVWHVYEDLGRYELDACEPDPERVEVAVQLIARLHTRFKGHALLGEVRLEGGDRGIHFYESSVRDAIRALEACQPPATHALLRDRLLQRLYGLKDELPERAQALADRGGPETLLHGDLWTCNVFVIPTAAGLEARLIDWDRAGVGPASYDLSTFLLRFAPHDRAWILKAYSEEAERAGFNLPPARQLNYLFETAEYARFAHCVIWPAIALAQDHASWGWDSLADVDHWFEACEPVLACEHEAPVTSVAQP